MKDRVIGKVHSLQSFGAVDGPGIRYVVFLQGCNLKCGCCHNPDSQSLSGGTVYTPEEIVEKVTRYRSYFGSNGGITLSGGEPLLQAEFAHEVFSLCKDREISTCLDTSGSILTKSVKELLDLTDFVLLDIKYTNNRDYVKYAGCTLDTVLNFLGILDEKKIKTVLRQVIIPTLNDSNENIRKLADIANAHACVYKVELLPFKKICQGKYDSMGVPFPFADLRVPTAAEMRELNDLLNKELIVK